MANERAPKDNKLIVIDENNVMSQRSGYFALPWAFRHIINKVLSPRELAVYVQIGFYMDKNEICYPSLDELAADMKGVSRGNQLSGPIGKLVDKGFLVKDKRPLPWRTEKHRKLIFQRPSIEYTLKTLRKHNHIDVKEHQKALDEWDRPRQRTKKRETP